MAKEREKREEKRARPKVSAERGLDNRPSLEKARYLKITDERVKKFEPQKNKDYSLWFLPWKSDKKKNKSCGDNGWATNRVIHTHSMLGPDNAAHLCPLASFGRACSVCEEFGHLKQEQPGRGTKESKDFWTNRMAPLLVKHRELFFVHDPTSEEKKNLSVWDWPLSLFSDDFWKLIGRKKKFLSFADFDEGFVVEFSAKEKKIGDSGTCVECVGISLEQREPVPDWMVDACHEICVDDFVVETPNSVLKSFMSNPGSGQEEEEEAPEEEKSTARGRVTTRAKVDEEEEVEEPEEEEEEPEGKRPPRAGGGKKPAPKKQEEPEDEEEEEPEEEKPAPRRGGGKTSASEPEEDEEPEEEDEDEEPPPRRRGK